MLAGLACASVLLAGCNGGSGGVLGQAKNEGGTGGYIAGDGTVEQLSVAKRGKPLTLSGTLLDGRPWSTSQAAGKVVVLNMWGSWCAPCQGELPDLQKAWTQLQSTGKPAVLMGVDVRDTVANARATATQKGLTYPSLNDEDGRLQLKVNRLAGNATPTTLVLDSRHRVAARVKGPVDTSTLVGLVDDALTQK